jgi:hypothetical protein
MSEISVDLPEPLADYGDGLALFRFEVDMFQNFSFLGVIEIDAFESDVSLIRPISGRWVFSFSRRIYNLEDAVGGGFEFLEHHYDVGDFGKGLRKHEGEQQEVRDDFGGS